MSAHLKNGNFPDTRLARLCRYYLECLNYDNEGVSTCLNSKQGTPDYFEIPFIPRAAKDFVGSEAYGKLLERRRNERGSYRLYFGYPILIQPRAADYMVEPLLLFPLETGDNGEPLLDIDFPIINPKSFETLSKVSRKFIKDPIAKLKEEIGITSDVSNIKIAELAMQLQAVRPQWPWMEAINPDTVNEERGAIENIDKKGIYNRAVILMAEKPAYTQGLESELRSLAAMPPEDYAETALGRWLNGEDGAIETIAPTEPLIEVLPMNSEQRDAINIALTSPTTVITGPPGTGKSQLIANLLMNAAWNGKRVLFTSQNNNAVDIVENRVNALGHRPFLLRVGGQKSHQEKLAEHIMSLLSSTATRAECEELSTAKASYQELLNSYKKLSLEEQHLIASRNAVDSLEQSVEEFRKHLGASLFARVLDLNMPKINAAISSLETAISALEIAIGRTDIEQAAFPIKSLWSWCRKHGFYDLAAIIKRTYSAFVSRFLLLSQQDLASIIRTTHSTFAGIDINLTFLLAEQIDTHQAKTAFKKAIAKVEMLKKILRYRWSLKELQTNSLESIALKKRALLAKMAVSSKDLWELWLRIQSAKRSVKEKQQLSDYKMLLKMILDTGGNNDRVRRQYNDARDDVVGLLPCWAVTALSAKGRIPFAANNFDLVIFDEASQCDIASALPLLYRAKAAVIIGDLKQLQHIPNLPSEQDMSLLKRYKLADDFLRWSYFQQSLFGLGMVKVTGERIIQLTDHYRSHEDIISFSNTEFYGGKLRIATDYSKLQFPNPSEAGVTWIDIKGQVCRPANGGAINSLEAEAVVAALRDLVLTRKYKGSIGVVTPFRAQANDISIKVNRDKGLASALNERDFIVDTVHKFQGDERDVMLFSPVVSSGISKGAQNFLRNSSSLFNVAITRARAQLITIGDIDACSSPEIGYLSRFALYAQSLEKRPKALKGLNSPENKNYKYNAKYPKVANPDDVSDWEKIFYAAAYKAGHRLIPQYVIEKYVVDFLLVEGNKKLVIEVDGEQYHKNWTGELCRRDQIRNDRLIELGYDVIRCWVYEIRDDMEGCLKRLSQWRADK